MGGIRFLKEVEVAAIVESGLGEDVAGVTRGKDDRGVGMLFCEALEKFGAIHAGHDDIGKKDVELAIVLLGDFERFEAVAGSEDMEAMFSQDEIGKFAQDLFILGEENHSLLAADVVDRRVRGFAMDWFNGREENLEDGAFADFAEAIDLTAVLLDDGVYGGEAEAGIFAGLSGAEKGFEEVLLVFFGEAETGVGDRELDVFAWAEMDVIVKRLLELQQFRAEGQLAPVQHGIARMNGEIDDQSFQLAAVCADVARKVRGGGDSFDGVAHEPANQREDLLQDDVEVQRFRCSNIFTADSKELVGEADGAFGALNDLLDIFLQGMFAGETGTDQAAVAGNDGEEVVEVVCDATGEASDGFHFLAV